MAITKDTAGVNHADQAEAYVVVYTADHLAMAGKNAGLTSSLYTIEGFKTEAEAQSRVKALGFAWPEKD